MQDILSLLKSFNRKERFFLIGHALGNPEFRLSNEYRKTVGEIIHIDIPEDSFVAMDYHLDWIFASLYCAEKGNLDFIEDNSAKKLNSNQEDVDLIIAFKQEDIVHIILIEAKAESGWTNKQFISKAEKLKYIFGENKCIWENVKPYFLLTSPRRLQNLKIDELPTYLRKPLKELWFKLPIPNNLIKITRCDGDGKASITGSKWKVEKT